MQGTELYYAQMVSQLMHTRRVSIRASSADEALNKAIVQAVSADYTRALLLFKGPLSNAHASDKPLRVLLEVDLAKLSAGSEAC